MNKLEKNACIYCRVSTPKQAQENESFDTQESICRGIANLKGANVVPNGKVWAEPFTGSKDKRPIFDEMINFIRKSPVKIDYLIFRDFDRLTRGGASSFQSIKAELAKYGCDLVDSFGIIQPLINSLSHTGFEYTWSKFSTSEITETIKAETAKDERRTIVTRLVSAQISSVQKGFKIRQASDGFVNKRVYIDGKKRVIMEPDPVRAPYYIEMFKLKASGKYDDTEIVEKINAIGYKSKEQNLWDKSQTKIIGKRGNNSLTVKQLQKAIQKPIFCGIICEKWTHYKPVKAQFDGLVDIKTFSE